MTYSTRADFGGWFTKEATCHFRCCAYRSQPLGHQQWDTTVIERDGIDYSSLKISLSKSSDRQPYDDQRPELQTTCTTSRPSPVHPSFPAAAVQSYQSTQHPIRSPAT